MKTLLFLSLLLTGCASSRPNVKNECGKGPFYYFFKSQKNRYSACMDQKNKNDEVIAYNKRLAEDPVFAKEVADKKAEEERALKEYEAKAKLAKRPGTSLKEFVYYLTNRT